MKPLIDCVDKHMYIYIIVYLYIYNIYRLYFRFYVALINGHFVLHYRTKLTVYSDPKSVAVSVKVSARFDERNRRVPVEVFFP